MDFTELVDLASERLGGAVLFANDEFFAPKENLLKPSVPVFIEGKYTDLGKWMDGWETRRRRTPGFDWCIVRLGLPGVIRGVVVDTSHFKGNYPDTCSIDGTRAFADDEWFEVLPRTKLQPHTRHVFIDELSSRGPVTHLRLNVFPDGGVSRLRVHGVATEEGRGNAVARYINTLMDRVIEAQLKSCCGSSEWVRRMIASRPFASWSDLIRDAEAIWNTLTPDDWREAFAAHPRIGESSASKWARQEQSATASASSDVRDALAEANREYEARFGHIYIVCATGRTADEMLAMAWQRLENTPHHELRVAAEEQMKITKLRLMKLVG